MKKEKVTVKKLSPQSYWIWRHKIEEMHHAETKVSKAELQYSSIEKDIEILRLKAAIYKDGVVKAARDNVSEFKKQYEEIKLQLETEIGQSLNGCTIDDVTFEVRKVD